MHRLKYKTLIQYKMGKYHDGNGLYIRITSQGRGLWTFRYRLNKKSREMSLGSFPDISLAEARQMLSEQKKLVFLKIDPLVEKKKNEAIRCQQNKPFSFIANMYIDKKMKDEWNNPKSEQQWKNTIATYAAPILDKKPLIDINTNDIIEVLDPIWKNKTETARRLQQRLFRIMGYAKIKNWYPHSNPAEWNGNLKEVMTNPFKLQKIQHFASLNYNLLPKFYQQLTQFDLLSAYAMRLLILTATRTKEIIEAERHEFDTKRRLWIIPAHKMKARKEHKIPLSDEALSIVEMMRKKHNHLHIFTNPDTTRHISNGAMLVFLKKHFTNFKITVHGFRSTFKDWAEENNKYQHNAIEFCLAHQLPDKIEKAYMKTDLIDARRQIMQDWENYILKK